MIFDFHPLFWLTDNKTLGISCDKNMNTPQFIVLLLLLLLPFFFFFFTNSRFFGNPVSRKFTGTIFQQYLFTLCLCITNILITLPILKILHQWKYYSSLKAQIMVNSLPTKYVIIKVGTLVFRHNAIAHLIDYNIV